MERIDCSGYETCDLIVRVHTDATISDSAASISIEVVPDGFTMDDPAQSFFADELDTPVTFTGASPPTAGNVQVRTYTSGLGAMLAVRVKGEQSNPAGAALTARISIELALREC